MQNNAPVSKNDRKHGNYSIFDMATVVHLDMATEVHFQLAIVISIQTSQIEA